MIDAFLTSPEDCPNLRRVGLRPPSTSFSMTPPSAVSGSSPRPVGSASVAAIHRSPVKRCVGVLIAERVRDVRFPILTAAAA